MERRGTSTAVPKLRFPEFLAAPKWCVKPMNDLYSFMRNNTLSRDKLNYENGGAKNIHYGDIHTKFSTLFDITKEIVPYVNRSEEIPGIESEDYCVEGDLIFADASEDTNDVGKSIEIIRLAGEKLLSGQHTILARRKGNTLVVGFGGHLFRSGLIRSRIEKEAQGTKIYQISSSRLSGIDITFPADKREQQKIADCLTSLDEVITAQGRKVEALKAHKRGLMQQLFPREGETRPRLRFPEFRNAPEWQQKTLAEIANVKASGDLDSSLFSETQSGDFPHPVYSNAVERNGLYGYYSVPQYPRDSVTITARGTLGIAFFRDHEFMGIGRLLVVSDLMDVHPRFLTECWNHLAVISNEVTSIPQLTAVTARATKLPIPRIEEQSRIADCLSSLDTQIAAESHQLAALKTHKQGLMQQLFPTPEAASA